MVRLPQQALDSCAHVLTRYPLLDHPSPIIAFSGGKDSIALAHIMRELGKLVRLRAVDMGYSPTWKDRIRGLARRLELDLVILDVRSMTKPTDPSDSIKADMSRRRAFLDDLARQPMEAVTPCTSCYNCKLLALVQSLEGDDSPLYFGHHGDDMISSFLKACIMYHDRWVDGHLSFLRSNYVALVRRLETDLLTAHSAFESSFLNFLDSGHAMTDEPPYEARTLHDVRYEIGRPLIHLEEDDLRAYTNALIGNCAESSGCGHTVALATRHRAN